MRVLLFTGKGGVGKTTAAAGTATLAAHRGMRTLVLSTDAAHSLGDAFDAPVGPEPTEVDTDLYAQQVDTQQRFEQHWGQVQDYLLAVLDAAGVDRLEAEELTVLPGAEEVLALLEVRNQVRSGRWDLVVVDCAPTAETLRLLALPEALAWYMERVFPIERRVIRSLRPVLSRVAGVPMPQTPVLDAVERLHDELADVRRVLTQPYSSVRLVLTPESVVVAEARRTLTSLALYGYRVDAVLANRVFPADSQDAWLRGWAAAQAQQLEEIEQCFVPLPVYRSPYRAAEPVGVEELAAFAAAAYGSGCRVPDDPFAVPDVEEPLSVERSGEQFVLSLALPLADRREMDLVRKGDELVLTVGSHRRVLALPGALRRREIVGAELRGGRLRVRFAAEEITSDERVRVSS
ncbi:arsenic-transporting ATPase [Carbonactinospora thermoautotrophica]|nr:ArsA family ATPase [Carbonactinospora thermoautotrophica]MCX9190827.1 arsenic-transporting ATPase [Carbonactinospora thermoautotrophica]